MDFPGHADYIKNMITGAAQIDGAILVVAAPTGPCPRPASTSCWPARSGCPTSSSPSTRSTPSTNNEELLELVELEVRELLSRYEFPGDNMPVVRVSALKALEGDKEAGDQVMTLMEAVNTVPDRPIDRATNAHRGRLLDRGPR